MGEPARVAAQVALQKRYREGRRLVELAHNGETEAALEMIAAGCMLDAPDNNGGCTALIRATIKGRTEIALALIEAGADLDLNDESGCTPLMMAAEFSRPEIAAALIAAKASVDLKDRLYRDGQGARTALIRATIKGRTEIALALIEAGADLDLNDESGCTPLMMAAEFSRPEIAAALIAAKASVDLKDRLYRGGQGGKTALEIAAEKGHDEIVALLRPRPPLRLFAALDLDGDGTVTYGELRKGFRGKRKEELRKLAEECGHDWKSLEDRLNDLPNVEGFSLEEFEACLNTEGSTQEEEYIIQA